MKDRIFVNAGTYNKFCWNVERMQLYFAKTTMSKDRYRFYDDDGNVVAYYDERKERGWIKRPHCELTGKTLYFPTF